MPAPSSFDYALVRVVPDVEREELINAGVTLHCHDRQYRPGGADSSPMRWAIQPRR